MKLKRILKESKEPFRIYMGNDTINLSIRVGDKVAEIKDLFDITRDIPKENKKAVYYKISELIGENGKTKKDLENRIRKVTEVFSNLLDSILIDTAKQINGELEKIVREQG